MDWGSSRVNVSISSQQDLFATPVVILAGGFGTRLGDVSGPVPKPMVEVNGTPLLLHIMDQYADQGFKRFIILGGFRVAVIKQFFSNYRIWSSDIRVSLSDGSMEQLPGAKQRDYEVTILDTGLSTMTGGRLHRARRYLENFDNFFLTYGDGLSDIDFIDQLKFHLAHGKTATVTAVTPTSKFGHIQIEPDRKVSRFVEKPQSSEDLISGGFFILNRSFLDQLTGDGQTLEEEPLRNLASAGELVAYLHDSFWFCVDTPKDLATLQEILTKQKVQSHEQ